MKLTEFVRYKRALREQINREADKAVKLFEERTGCKVNKITVDKTMDSTSNYTTFEIQMDAGLKKIG